MKFVQAYVNETIKIAQSLDWSEIDRLADHLAATRDRGGRLFILGVGGSAANASHAVNDFRKLCGIEAYAPTDNVAELTARTNDEGWETVFQRWLEVSRLGENDMILVLSVGGGSPSVSVNLVVALNFAHRRGAAMGAIVGRDGGYAKERADACVIIPTVNPERVTPHTEAFQGVLLHLLVSHPALQLHKGKWESLV